MKPFRITVVLMALLVLPLFASQVFAISITYTNLDTLHVPFGKISKNTDDRALFGIKIKGVTSATQYLEYINLKSFIQKAYSVEHLKLYRENNDTVGLQVPGDLLLQYKDIRTRRFDSNDTVPFTSLHKLLKQDPDSNLFYVAIDAFTDTVGAHPDLYDGQCLEVIVLPGKMRLSGPLDTNADTIYNRRYSSNPLDDTTGFCPDDPTNHGYPGCRYRLCFDTRGPQFTLHLCVGDSTCPDNKTIAQGDTVQICATDINETVVGCIHVFGRVLTDWDHEVSSAEMFLQDSIVLCHDRCGGDKQTCECNSCDDTFHVEFVIPDFANGVNGVPSNRLPYSGDMRGIDADTGQWFVCAWAQDSAGNIDTICIGHDDLLPWKIDTRKPNIDSVSFFLWWDANHDGKVALGDTVAVFGWAVSNVWLPQLEVDSMIADMSYFGKGRVWLNDIDNNNKVFRAFVCLDVPVPGLDTADCDLNSIKVWAWDNACNYDTERVGICNPVDLEKPGIDQVVYKYYLDYDTSHSCVGIGDTVEITTITSGSDIESVTADMKDAGIDSLIRTALPLPYKSIDTYDTIWEVTKPPIDDGKDKDNTVPPLNDADYRVKVTVCDDAGNCSTLVSNVLNRTLDTRRPRPIGYFCQDTVPCALHVHSLAHGIIELDWSKTCQEKDAWYFYVYYSTDGINWDSIGSTYENETGNPNFNFWTSEPLPAGYYYFKVQTEDSCDNLGPFSCEVAAFADSTPPKTCIVFPDSGGIYGAPFTVKARTEDRDIYGASLWYRLRADLNDPPTGPIGPWTPCLSFPSMYRPDSGLVFLDTVACIHDYVGMVELMPLSCDVYGNCQDTIRGYQDACIDDSLQNLRPGHFLFDWDTTRACARLVSVNDTISPQTSCGFNVNPDIMNQVIIDVDGAKPTDLFTIDVKALNKWKSSYRIDYRNHVTMPCTIMVSVDNWDFGTQHLYVRITSEANGKECVPCPMIIDLCVPWQTTPCITIVRPLEWMRIPCSKTEKTCVPIWAEITPGCPETLVTQVKFFYSKNTPGPPWNLIEEVVEPDTEWVLGHPKLFWETCWNNQGLLQDGDTVYLVAEGFNQYHVGSTSKMVKVFADCNAPQVKLRIEDVITTCQGIPKVAGEIILKALVVDTLVDITELNFWYKLHSDPDIPAYWHKLCDGQSGWCWDCDEELQPWSENIWAGDFDTEDLPNQTWIDIRVSVKDQAGNVWQDYDEDGKFDDSTFSAAVLDSAGITVFVDNQAPAPAISMVADTAAKIYNVNPSTLLGGSGEAYVKAGDDINSQISVLPSEDTCEVMKVEWFLCSPEREDDVVTAPKQSPALGGKFIHVDEHQGDNCENPIELTLPRDLPFDDTNHTCGRGDDYHHTCLAPFDSSEDIIYKLNITTNVILRIKWQTFHMRNSGLALFDECPGHGGPHFSGPDLTPPSGPKCGSYEKDAHEWHQLKGKYGCPVIFLEPGTYYLMLDSKHGCKDGALVSGQSTPQQDDGNFELEITGEATGCQYVGISNDPYHFPVNFNPVKDGLIPAYELEDHFWHGTLQAVLYDSLGNYKTDNVGLYILDVTPSQAVIVEPLNDSYVSGDVTLRSKALNDYEICKVCYEYKAEGDSVWHPVNDGYPNACTTERSYGSFWLTWHTLNTIPDGAYYLRAVATDCSNNVDTLPPTIKVTVSNGVPVVTMDDPRICSRTCPDDTVDTLGYVSGTVPLYATVSSTIPVTKVEFYYKCIFTYPSNWTYIGTDDFPTDGKYSVEWSTPSDGRYQVKAQAYTASGKYGESKPIVISVDNSGPFTEIISIMGNQHPNGMDITKGAVIPIEIVAIDSTSNDGWTRCYNSGLTKISVCIAMCDSNYKPTDTTEITKCFEVDSVYDGIHTVQWNTSGLEYAGCKGCYYIYVKATDCLGNVTVSNSVKVYVSDITAPVTTIGGFDGNYVYGYSSERVKTLLFEYAQWSESGPFNWIPIGWSDTLPICSFQTSTSCSSCPYYLYKTSWDPTKLTEGKYQIRVISHDTCSNQNDSLAPVAYFTVEGGTITPDNPGVLGALSFMKNWCQGGMHGLVHETCSQGTPVVIARYISSYECVEMQPNLNFPHDYDGSFFAHDIENGGPAKFFSSVTVKTGDEHMTGEPAYVTYLEQGTFDVVQVKRDLGTHGTYQNGCVDITIPAGAVGSTFVYDRYIWVSPTIMPWVPITQPDLKPIGDNDGHATYVAFTDCYYCCGWWSSHYGGKQDNILKSPGDGSDCCFNPGATHYAKIKMCYDSTVTTDKEHLTVMWWDCECGEFKSDNIYYPPGVEGFNTTNHTVEFATSCLSGPFVVVQLLERPCAGSIVVNMRAQDIQPYGNGYTNSMPKFTSLLTDNVQGPSGIDKSSIQFKVDLFNPGELIRIYDGSHEDVCHKWSTGFGSFVGAGYDKVAGLFKAGWNDSTYYNTNDRGACKDCYNNYCKPMYPLKAGDHIATLTAQNNNIQTCTDTVHFTVDATQPKMWFADSIGAYVGKNPYFCMYFTDAEAGIDKSSIYLDVFGEGSSYPDPSDHYYDATIFPDQLHWVNDTTVCVDLTYEFSQGGYLHVFVYGGPYWKCGASCPNYNYYGYTGGVADLVGNRMDPIWRYFVIDAYGPTITNAYTTLCDPVLKFQIMDAMTGVGNVYVYEDGDLTNLIVQDQQNASYWYYTPSAGPHHVDIKAYDKLGNLTVKTFDLTGDCTPPVVSFVPSYVSCKTPTVKIVVTDAGTGVNWDTVKVDLYYSDLYLQTFEPGAYTRNGDTITVVGNGSQLNLSDGSDLYAVVYSEKTGTTSYTKGPFDLAGNWTATQWIKKAYKADCYGPSITFRGNNYCDDSLKFEITDAKSGLAYVYVYEDSSLRHSPVRDQHNPIYWYYTPSAGRHHLDILAIDMVNDSTLNSFDVTGDCTPPVVSFVPSFVSCKTPTVKVVVTDAGAGVDWTKLKVDLYYSSLLLQTFEPTGPNAWVRNGDTITVVGNGAQFNLYDGYDLYAVVYSEKSSATSYTKGPVDLAGNWTDTKWITKDYRTDCYGPSITFRGTGLCDDSLKYEITDAKSGLAHVYVYEDSSKKDLLKQDTHNPIYWYYYPSAGWHHVDIAAIDMVNDTTLYSFDHTGDCTPPVVTFIPGSVNCVNPTMKAVVSDAGTGVNWTKVKVDLYYSSNLQEAVSYSRNGDTITVKGDGDLLGLTDGVSLNMVVYSEKNYGTSYTKGPIDLAGNYQTSSSYYSKSYVTDCLGPTITWASGADSCSRPLLFKLTDNRSGVDSSLITITENGQTVTTWSYDLQTDTLKYTPSAGRKKVEIKASDKVGNPNYNFLVFWSKDDCTPPLVTFNAEFVTCDSPTVKILLHDDASGVDWTKIYVDMYKYSDRIQSFTPEFLTHRGDTLTVKGDGAWLGLTDGSNLYVNVYSAKNPSWKGPVDSAGNYQTSTSLFSKTYIADCSGPSISWMWPAGAPVDSCSTPLTFKISDTYSGVKTIGITEDGVPSTAYSYDRSSQMLTYTPSAGKHKVVITGTDNLGNVNTYTFNRKDDCLPPGVEFVKGYVAKNPTVKVVVRDDKIGVDWNTVNVDLYQTVYAPYERCTFTAADIALNSMRHGDTVIVSCTMDLDDGRALTAYVYSEKSSMGSYGKGPGDLSGNFMPKWQEATYTVDAKGPVLKLLTPTYATPIRVQVQDSASGVNPTSFEIRENGVDLTYNYDASTNVLTYTPTAGAKTTVTITVADNLGNLGSLSYRNWDDDAVGPVLDTNLVKQTLMAPPIKIKFTDDKSGVNWDSLTFRVDGHVVPHESLTIERDQGLIEYTPQPGRKQILVSVKDNAGNMSGVWPFWSEAGELYFTGNNGTYNYPNPFDPREKPTYIVLGLSKSVLATIKIYDFAGEYVRTLGPPDQVVRPTQEIRWDGKTDDGTEVANGTYLCYIKARDLDASKTVTAVIKITVLKKDK